MLPTSRHFQNWRPESPVLNRSGVKETNNISSLQCWIRDKNLFEESNIGRATWNCDGEL